MTKLLKFFTLLVFSSMLLVACNKDEMDITPTDTQTETTTNTDDDVEADSTSTNNYIAALTIATDSTNCFDIQFPMNFLLLDGTTATADTEEDLDAIFESENYPVDFAYPINLANADGETIAVNNEEELVEVLEDCFGEDWEDDDYTGDDDYDECWEFVYPLAVNLADGSTVDIENEEGFAAIYADMDSTNYITDFVYPIQVTILEDGAVLTANSSDELDEILIENCGDECDIPVGDDGDWDEPCFEFTFPISFNVNGDIQTANSEEDLGDIFAGLDENDEVEMAFPVSVTFEGVDGVQTAQDEEELEALIEQYCD